MRKKDSENIPEDDLKLTYYQENRHMGLPTLKYLLVELIKENSRTCTQIVIGIIPCFYMPDILKVDTAIPFF